MKYRLTGGTEVRYRLLVITTFAQSLDVREVEFESWKAAVDFVDNLKELVSRGVEMGVGVRMSTLPLWEKPSEVLG
jgi:hypothetical protein